MTKEHLLSKKALQDRYCVKSCLVSFFRFLIALSVPVIFFGFVFSPLLSMSLSIVDVFEESTDVSSIKLQLLSGDMLLLVGFITWVLYVCLLPAERRGKK